MPPRCRTAEKMLDPSEKVWSTLRCLEYQLEAHEARFHRDGDVNWQAIRHMIMVAQHEARTTGAALRRAWTDEDAVGDDLAQIKLQLRETDQELQRLRQVHMESQSKELTEARSVSAGLREKLDAANAAWNLQCAGIERLQAFVWNVRRILPLDDFNSNKLLGIEAALKTLDADTQPAPVTEPLDDSTGADGPGQS